MGEKVRINKYLASIGVASRRKVDSLISLGQISVNGKVQTEPGIRIEPDKDKIVVSGKEITPSHSRNYYYLLNKPIEVVSSSSDDRGRITVVDLVKSPVRVYPVGRLDYFTSGLIILTNDGDFTLKLTHPRYHIPKTYLLQARGVWNNSKKVRIEKGIMLDDGLTSPAKVILKSTKDNRLELLITIHEGKNRQVRRMCQALDLTVLSLTRVSIGPIDIGSLKVGEYRELSDDEVSALKKLSRG